MSESWGQNGAAASAQQTADDGMTAGALLRQAREAAGLHVAALAVSLKVPVRKLEALEDNRWDLLPDAVFVRALASSVCRTLKIDPQPVLQRLPQTSAPRLIHEGDGINTPFRAPSDGAGPTWFDQLTRPVFLAVFALLFGALVLILLPTTQQEAGGVAGADAPAGPRASVTPGPAAPSAEAERSPVQVAQVPTATAPAVPASAAARAASSMAAAQQAASPVVPATTPITPATAAAGIIVFRTREPSWVEVTDAKGVVAVRRLLAGGEAVGASGTLPLQVTIGRVDATEVQVRGKPFDLKPVSKDNVARFEIK